MLNNEKKRGAKNFIRLWSKFLTSSKFDSSFEKKKTTQRLICSRAIPV